MKVVVTGGGGFLGYHTRVRLQATTDHEVVAIARESWPDLATAVADADAVIHIAGVNRGEPDEVEQGNVTLAQDVAAAVDAAGHPVRIVFANSTQIDRDNHYGRGKSAASELLQQATEANGGSYVDVVLPNLFGEFGRPDYNAFVPTFVARVIDGEEPSVVDNQVELLHVQGAAAALVDALSGEPGVVRPRGTEVSVARVWEQLQEFHRLYPVTGDIPPLETPFDISLFNTYRAALFPARYPIMLDPKADDRGWFVETVRAHGSPGQTSVSTTKPGITRGEHYHLRKIERFVVVGGQARISLRKLLTDEVVSFDVSGDQPAVIDMPTMWVHNITNIGETELTTLFWTQELFDPADPDTYPEPVGPAA